MDKSVQRQTREIADNAITEISPISQLVNSTHSAAASNQRSSSTSSPLSSGSASSALPSGSESGSSSRSSGSLVMNCTEDSRVCKEQLVVVLLLLRAVEAALIRHSWIYN